MGAGHAAPAVATVMFFSKQRWSLMLFGASFFTPHFLKKFEKGAGFTPLFYLASLA